MSPIYLGNVFQFSQTSQNICYTCSVLTVVNYFRKEITYLGDICLQFIFKQKVESLEIKFILTKFRRFIYHSDFIIGTK